MKVSMSLQKLAAEVKRQATTKEDVRVVPGALVMRAHETDGIRLQVGPYAEGHPFPLSKLAHNQLAEHLDIPRNYYQRMLEKQPDLLANNVNTWLHKNGATKRMIRMLDGRIRAIVSDSFETAYDNYDLLEAVWPALQERIDTGKLIVMSSSITETRMYIKCVDETILKDIPAGTKLGEGHHIFDTVSPALTLSNSEVGFGNFSIETGMFTRQCTNLATFQTASMKRRHVGSKSKFAEDQEIEVAYKDDTRIAKQRAVFLEARDTVAAVLDGDTFNKRVDQVKKLTAETFSPSDVIEVVNRVGRQFGFNETEGKSVLDHLIGGGNFSAYGLFNAVTRTAEDLEDYDRATEFERFGGKLVELPANDVKLLTKAA